MCCNRSLSSVRNRRDISVFAESVLSSLNAEAVAPYLGNAVGANDSEDGFQRAFDVQGAPDVICVSDRRDVEPYAAKASKLPIPRALPQHLIKVARFMRVRFHWDVRNRFQWVSVAKHRIALMSAGRVPWNRIQIILADADGLLYNSAMGSVGRKWNHAAGVGLRGGLSCKTQSHSNCPWRWPIPCRSFSEVCSCVSRFPNQPSQSWRRRRCTSRWAGARAPRAVSRLRYPARNSS